MVIFRIFEGDQSEVTNLNEAEYREQILEETLKNVFMRKVSIYNNNNNNNNNILLPKYIHIIILLSTKLIDSGNIYVEYYSCL